MTRRLLLCALALLCAPVSAWLWPLPLRHIVLITAIWVLGMLTFLLFMVGPGLLTMWAAAFLVPYWGWPQAPSLRS